MKSPGWDDPTALGYVQRTVGSVKSTLEDIEAMVLRSFEDSDQDMAEDRIEESTLDAAL